MNHSKYFYDKQIRRYLLQISRIFSGYQVSDGFETINGSRVKKYKTVPVAVAALNRLGASYLSSNSENIVNHAPAMAFYISDLQPSQEYRSYQHYTKSTQFTEKKKTPTGEYVNVEGKKYEVTQVQPVPLEMKITLDIWTSSIEQKMELIEQILVYFNPGFEFRVSASRFDMGQVSNIELESIQWSSKGVPIGGDTTSLEFATLVFKILPVYISAPAKITRQNKIKSIALGIATTDDIKTLDDIFADIPETHIYVTPSGYMLNVTKETIDNEKKHVARLTSLDSDVYHSWGDMFRSYGVSESDSCLVRIRQSDDADDGSNDVYASLRMVDDTIAVLEYDTDTFKPNSISPINYIISGNSVNEDIYNSDVDTSVLVASKMSNNAVWNLDVEANSIITKTDAGWVVTFDPILATNDEYVLHSTTREQYKFDASTRNWEPTMLGTYKEGFWSFDIQKVLKR